VSNNPAVSFVTHPVYPYSGQLVIDGKLDAESLVSYHGKSCAASVFDPDAITRLLDMRCIELAALFGALFVPFSKIAPPHEFMRNVGFDWLRTYTIGARVEFEVPLNIRTWSKAWSITDFMDGLQEVRQASQSEASIIDPTTQAHGAVASSCVMSFPIPDQNARAIDVLRERIPGAVGLVNGAANRLDARALQQGVLRVYRFPPRIQAAACRYLDYFAQFLSDLGFDAHSTREHRAGMVIFTVTPSSQAQALHRIAEALTIYSNLPAFPDFEAVSAGLPDPAVVELRRVVGEMKSELAQARANISSLMLADDIPRLDWDAAALASVPAIDHPVANNPPCSDREPLLGGLISLGAYESFGVRFDLAAFLRLLKRTVRRLGGTTPH
jgi:hypothetical protein